MIIKNISPYPKSLVSLGKFLMPGDECDLCGFTQKQRDDCVDLQEGFRKGDLICIGFGHKENYNPRARLQAAKERLQQGGSAQPLVSIVGGGRPNAGVEEVQNTTRTTESEQIVQKPVYHYGDTKRPDPPKIINGQPIGLIEKDKNGIFTVKPLPTKQQPEEVARPVLAIEQPQPDIPHISVERMREIMSQRCISFCTNGSKCKRWAVVGYEYCIQHMPKKLLEEYKNQKKQQFFKE